MTMRRADGSVFSENTPANAYDYAPVDHGVYKVLLTNVKYVDDKKNMLGKTATPEVLYDGVVVGGKNEGQQVSNIRDTLGATGGTLNYGERIYRVCSKPLVGDGSTPLNKQDGDIVYCAFIAGNPAFPIIVGRAKNALDRTNTGATKADGPRRRWQYNGLFFEINKNGEMSIKRKGGKFKDKEGYFEPVKDGDEVSMQWTEKKATFNIGKDAIKQTWDGTAETFKAEFKSGLKVEQDGKNDKMVITTAGGAVVTIDGKGKNVTAKAGATEVIIDGNSGKITLKGDFVDLGKSVSDFVTLFTELATAFNSHTHPFQYFAGPAPAAGITQPPPAPLPVSVGSQTVAVQK